MKSDTVPFFPIVLCLENFQNKLTKIDYFVILYFQILIYINKLYKTISKSYLSLRNFVNIFVSIVALLLFILILLLSSIIMIYGKKIYIFVVI